MIDSARATAGSRSPASQPLAPGGSASTYSRIAWAKNNSARRATTSGDGACSATKRSELSTHSSCRALDVDVEHRRQRVEQRMGARLGGAEEAAPDFGRLRPVAAGDDRWTPSSVTSTDLAGVDRRQAGAAATANAGRCAGGSRSRRPRPRPAARRRPRPASGPSGRNDSRSASPASGRTARNGRA